MLRRGVVLWRKGEIGVLVLLWRLRLAALKFVWKRLVFPLYRKFASHIDRLIFEGKVRSADFLTAPVELLDIELDRYDGYSRTER